MTYEIIMHAEVLKEHLSVLTERLSNLAGPLLDIGSIVSHYIDANFSSAPWPPLSENTVRIKEAMGYPPDPLVRTGDMKDAATSDDWQISRSGRGWRASLEVPGYSAFHFTGTTFMPRRDYALLPDGMEGDIVSILEAHLFAGL